MHPLLLALPLCLALVAPLAADELGTPLPPGLLSAEVLPGWQDGNGERIAALRIRLAPGWKTYWRVPGDAGVPPEFDFEGSGNLDRLQVIWPAPEVSEQNGLRSVGYHDALVLPLRITPADPSQPVNLAASLDFGICHEVCVPVQLELSAELSGPGAPDAAIRQAMAAAPLPRPGLARCLAEPIRDGMRVTAAITLPEAADEVALFELVSTPMWVSEPTLQRQGDTLWASVDFVPDSAQPFDLDQDDLRITVVSAAGAIEIDGCPKPE